MEKYFPNQYVILTKKYNIDMDMILLAQNGMYIIIATRRWLPSTLDIEDMWKANFLLGVKIIRDHSRRLLGLFQETYIKKILEQFWMQNCKPIDTLIEKSYTLSLDQCPKNDEERT